MASLLRRAAAQNAVINEEVPPPRQLTGEERERVRTFAWRRMVLLMRMILEYTRLDSVMKHRLPLVVDPNAQLGRPEGHTLTPSKSKKMAMMHTEDPSTCNHDLAYRKKGGNASAAWETCLKCGSRWSRDPKCKEAKDMRTPGTPSASSENLTPAEKMQLLKELKRAPKCARCGKGMTQKVNHADHSQFWGCLRYPLCDFTRPGPTWETVNPTHELEKLKQKGSPAALLDVLEDVVMVEEEDEL
mmetsp:Transcript_63043/g.150212  ORF Transcript_63043/g.150212 Transcript_63043/m.150212 type:complete len:244 (+) Transcript_63043:113-844(+)|eukprot:CAMPEP_0178426948 /NCGR_PEP_ID=MMETSP0689_2-20121128/29494_1 /TAXON_ID=160604 /ORGANISM="Amphidinium massartii, Strain CS-259" /LENGTH=243 /DNA_ID=CAMNT_0020048643 /DNA_START=64 /DNA_END=795 /DNA_ORIENTATION=-